MWAQSRNERGGHQVGTSRFRAAVRAWVGELGPAGGNRTGGPHDFALEDPVRLLHGGQLEFRFGAEVRVKAALAHAGIEPASGWLRTVPLLLVVGCIGRSGVDAAGRWSGG
jgi:hypothetical protein